MQEADSNDPEVWRTIGNALLTARGTPRDPEQATRWFQRGAESGHAPSMVSLGLRLQHPEFQNPGAAIEWFRKAAALGYRGGMRFLVFAYREGKGVPVDSQQAVHWFTA